MGTPAEHLPSKLSDDTINALLLSRGLPKATTIESPDVTAQYHAIYLISLPAHASSSFTEMVLRVSGHHLPRIKTLNEVGVMTWVTQNTTIPIPEIIAYDASGENVLGYEYTLLSRSPGVTLSSVYPSLSEGQILDILDQLADFMKQLHEHEWRRIGGLSLDSHGTISVSRVVDEAFWQEPDVKKFWPSNETISSLNIRGPYSSYTEYISDQIRKYIHLINIHASLGFMRKLIPRLHAFISVLPKYSAELDDVKLCLAHKDLHFANMLYDVATGRLTAILDWEFSGVVPITKWNPRRAFLWNGRDDANSGGEKQRLLELYSSRCKERGLQDILKTAYSSPKQESMQEVADFLRAITEVVPRGQRAELVPKWVAEVESNMSQFGV